ncbi:MAG TPA: hypothetical protein VHX88_00205 [Solirubrobacteraceae bacterium]|jgi:hypothetical protein|nr:hypothetical protein [Solirubrobacteraceae bacterium]
MAEFDPDELDRDEEQPPERPDPIARGQRTAVVDRLLTGSTLLALASLALAVAPGPLEVEGLILLVPGIALCWRAWRMGVHVELRGVLVYGLLRSERVPWEEIERFEVRSAEGSPKIGHLVLVGERPALPIGAIRGDGAQEAIERLNGELARWRSQ